MSSNSTKASSKKKSQKSKKSEVEDASEIRLREIAHEMESGTQLKEQTPLWYRVIMFSLLALGILWIIVFYITQGLFPIPDLGMWNVSIGVGHDGEYVDDDPLALERLGDAAVLLWRRPLFHVCRVFEEGYHLIFIYRYRYIYLSDSYYKASHFISDRPVSTRLVHQVAAGGLVDSAGYGLHDGRVDVPPLPVEGELHGSAGKLKELPRSELFSTLGFGDEPPGDAGADGTRVVRRGGNVDGGALYKGLFGF